MKMIKIVIFFKQISSITIDSLGIFHKCETIDKNVVGEQDFRMVSWSHCVDYLLVSYKEGGPCAMEKCCEHNLQQMIKHPITSNGTKHCLHMIQ